MHKILLGAAMSGVGLSLTGSAWAQWRDQGPGYGPWGMGWGMVHWFSPIMMFIFWAVLIVAIILFIRRAAASGGLTRGSAGAEDSALEILKKRYARGEIDKEEFEQKKRDLL